MARLMVAGFSISLDGYGAGPRQSIDEPLGVGGMALHQWVFGTRSWQESHGGDGGESGTVDDCFAAIANDSVGATIMGRNMFGPVRGPWDEPWDGWWEDSPPFHHQVFVLTHHPRESLTLSDTTFHFVTDGIEATLERAYDAAGGRDVRIGGGVSTVRQYLAAGLVDELHVAVVPVFLGSGERLFGDLDLSAYECTEVAASSVAHVRLVKRARQGSNLRPTA